MSALPVLAMIMTLAAPPAVPAKNAAHTLTAAQRDRLAGVLATLHAVQTRLSLEMVRGSADYDKHIAAAIRIIETPVSDDNGMSSPCPTGTCRTPLGCVPCYPPLCKFLRFEYDVAVFEATILKGDPAPAFLDKEKIAINVARDLNKIFPNLSADGFCQQSEMLMPMPCK